MSDSFPFDVDETLWSQLVDQLGQSTDYSEDELERGLTYMLGRRARVLLQSLKEDPDELIEELEIAITHSQDEK